MIDYADKFLNSLRSTSASRFHASKRLAARDRKLTRLTAFTSAYVIALTILPYFIKLPQQVTDNFNLITVAFSIVILVSSLFQYSSGDVVNAEQHQRCALEIDEIQRELRVKMSNISEAQLLEFCRRYDLVLQKYSINHDDVDFMKYQMDRPQDYTWLSRTAKLLILLRLAVTKHVYSLMLFLVTSCMIWLIFFYAYPSRLNQLP
jgi:SMODS and SLOG-associating 2TM effector domain family 5